MKKQNIERISKEELQPVKVVKKVKVPKPVTAERVWKHFPTSAKIGIGICLFTLFIIEIVTIVM